jgi:hypothetical protein
MRFPQAMRELTVELGIVVYKDKSIFQLFSGKV